MSLQLILLGGFEARLTSGAVADTPSRKTRALLAYLALPAGRAHARDKLVGLLWGDRGDKQAHDSLRQALSKLDRAIGKSDTSLLIKNHDTVALDASAVTVDALEFERLATSEDADELRRADGLYAGDLFDAFGVRDPTFEDWLRFERQRLRDLATNALKKLLARETGTSAVETAQRLVTLDPLQEEGHRALMRLYAESGEIGVALRQYEVCREILERELAVAPSPETDKLHRRLRSQQKVSGPAVATPIQDREQEPPPSATAPQHPPSNKFSIAVLPFTNMSGDPEQEYFCDSITEDIITELARDRSLLVIARNSCFQFRGPSVDIAAVRWALGVRYIVEGSVRKASGRIRVTAQLIDAVTQSHVWAERYDRDIQDIFAVQDQVTRAIVATLGGRIVASGAEQSRCKPTKNWVAHDYYLQGRNRDACFDHVGAETFFARAVELDPGYVHAHAWRADALAVQYWLNQQPETLRLAEASAQMALSLDGHDAWSHFAMGFVAMQQRRFDLAGMHFERAVSLNPNNVLAASDRADWLTRTGRPDEALQILDAAMRRDPFPAMWLWDMRFTALFNLKRYDDAIAALRNMTEFNFMHHAYFAAAYAHAGRQEDARREVAAFLAAKPGATSALVAAAEPYAQPDLLEHLLDGLRKAGLPK